MALNSSARFPNLFVAEFLAEFAQRFHIGEGMLHLFRLHLYLHRFPPALPRSLAAMRPDAPA
jgi:hypothetical protein